MSLTTDYLLGKCFGSCQIFTFKFIQMSLFINDVRMQEEIYDSSGYHCQKTTQTTEILLLQL